jgi:hypothetical protein
MRRLVMAALFLVVAAGCGGSSGIAGAGTPALPPATVAATNHTINGSLTLEFTLLGTPSDLPWNDVQAGGACAPHGTWASDVQQGQEVLLKDGSGSILGKTTLNGGVKVGLNCRFSYMLTQVTDAKFFTVEIGGRKGPVYSLDDLTKQNWAIDMSLTN